MKRRVVCSSLRYCLVIFALCFALGAQAQKFKSGKTEQEVEQEAFAFFDKEEYAKAMSLYEELLDVYPQDPEYNYYLGVCQVELNTNVGEAINHLKIASAKNVNTSVSYFLARAFHMNYQFHSAIRYYQKFKENYRKKASGIDRLIEMCQNGIPLVNSYTVLNVQSRQVVKQSGFFRNYQLTGFDDRLSKKSNDLKSRLDRSEDKDVACLSEDGKYLYFSSYGKNKKTGRDLFRSKREKSGGWGEAEPLTALNTDYDELYPFLSADGRTLYFCSQGHNSMGGFDIFKSVYNDITETWTEPENLGFPYNSAANDLFFATDTKEEYACFTSSRENGQEEFTVYQIKMDKFPEQKVVVDPDLLPEIALLKKGPVEEPKELEPSKEESPKPVLSEENKPLPIKYDAGNFPYFNFSINELLVYHNLAEFKSDAARRLFMEAKNDEFNADSLNRYNDELRAGLEALKGEPRNAMAKKIALVEQSAYNLSKTADTKYQQTRALERDYLKQNVVAELEMEVKPEVKPESKTEHLVMASEILPAKEKNAVEPSVPTRPAVGSRAGIKYHIQIGAFSKQPQDDYFQNVDQVIEEKVGNGNLTKYMVGNYSSFGEAKAKLPEVRKSFPNAFVVAYRDGTKMDLKQAIQQTDKEYRSAPQMESRVQPERTMEPSVGEEIEFRVQIGAYSEEVPEYIREKLKPFERYQIKFVDTGKGYTICTVGAFKSYASAAELKMKLRDAGVGDAFTVAYQGDQKISVKKALELMQ